MATTDYGIKYRCYQCGTKFYDLHRPEPLCPRCKANQKDAPPPAEPPRTPREARVAAEEVEDADVPDIDLGVDEDEVSFDEEGSLEDEEDVDAEEY
jgi:hypothetical protein